jgi:polysaccharide export outer membrane protein
MNAIPKTNSGWSLAASATVRFLIALILFGFSNFAQAQNAPVTGSAGYVYRLDSGDKVQVTVYGEPDLSGPYDVDGSGYIRLPLVGQIQAAGLTLKEFEAAAEAKLSVKYLVNPKVSAEVTNYRPFSILGEVNKPGEYPYEDGMTALNAVALGGGFTYRADQDYVYVRRKGSGVEEKMPANEKTLVFPGDTVRVDERIF